VYDLKNAGKSRDEANTKIADLAKALAHAQGATDRDQNPP